MKKDPPIFFVIIIIQKKLVKNPIVHTKYKDIELHYHYI
jgi:hypothetical protein